MSKKIAFYMKFQSFKDVIINANLDYGNPGIGGTQYLFLLTVKYLNKLGGKDAAIILTDTDFSLNDQDVIFKYVGDEKGAIEFCENNNIKNVVFNANIADRVNEGTFNTDVRIALWAHNTLSYKRQVIAARTESIHRVVCVSKAQYENMKDSICFPKCAYINNIISPEFYNNANISNYSEKKVIYIGSAVPQKGMHNLLKIWRHIELSEPNAKLYIIGGAKIWNGGAKTGELGIGGVLYDKKLCDYYKKIKNNNNVFFCGPLGWDEISELMKDCRVGVVNPSHYYRDETFCMSAVEIQTFGVPVVSRDRDDGLKTTILDGKSGFLRKTDKQIANEIVELLKNNHSCNKMGSFARVEAKEFVISSKIYKWFEIFENYEISSSKKNIISKDSLLLTHDYLLRIKDNFSVDKIRKRVKKHVIN